MFHLLFTFLEVATFLLRLGDSGFPQTQWDRNTMSLLKGFPFTSMHPAYIRKPGFPDRGRVRIRTRGQAEPAARGYLRKREVEERC